MTTNYRQTFITVSPDSHVTEAKREPRSGTVAALQLGMLLDAPYTLTSDDLLFEVHAIRHDMTKADQNEQRCLFDAKSKACLRASPLVKTHGWGCTTTKTAAWPQLPWRIPHTPGSLLIRRSR